MNLKIENDYVIGYEEDADMYVNKVIIPDGIKGIADRCFCRCYTFTDIKLPNSLEKIGFWAFSRTNLKKVSIPNTVTFIGASAFWLCKDLSSVALPNNIDVLEENLFYGCENLSNIEIPKSVRVIKDAVFQISALSEIDVPDSVIEIGIAAFFDCRKLARVTLSKNIKIIKESAFEECLRLEQITIPEGVEIIGGNAFCDCPKLIVNIPDNFSGWIGDGAFYGCKDINFKSYNVFKRLPYDSKITIGYKKVLDLYYQDKSFYSKEDMEDFCKFLLLMLTTMKNIIEFIHNNKKVTDFMFEINEYKAIKGLRNLMDLYVGNNAEVTSFLFDFIHNKLESMGLTETDFSQIEFNAALDELDEMSNSSNDEEEMKL